MQQCELPENLAGAPLLRIVERNVGRTDTIDQSDEQCEHRYMDGVETDETMPEEDLDCVAAGLREACKIDVSDNEARQDEKEIDAEVSAPEKRQHRSGSGGHVLVGVQSEHQQGSKRPNAGERRYIARR